MVRLFISFAWYVRYSAAVMHLETEGNVFETAEKTRNYLRSIYEKEGFAVGETVSKNFTRDLKRMVGRR